MDYYKVLGIGFDASKSEIKQAFRNLALQYHPDKHSSSPKGVKDGATLKFKQISEAYDVLSDDRKRADYNFRQRSSQGFNSSSSSTYGYGYGYQTQYQNPNSYNFYDNKTRWRRRGMNGREFVEISFRFLTTRAFLLNAAFVGVLLGGAFGIDIGREALWKLKNPGKSFEDAMDSIAKAKPVNDKS